MSFKIYLEEIITNQFLSQSITPYYSHFYEDFENKIETLHVIVEVTSKIDNKLIFSEGSWIKSNYKDWFFRTDQQNNSIGSLYHVHISRKKNINTQPQYSWDKLGKRHDAHKFDEPIPDYAKTLASNILGIDKKYLEAICINGKTIFLE